MSEQLKFEGNDEEWILIPENANSKAVEILKEEFFWDITDDISPFGKDDGWDTLMSYRDWRLENANENANIFLDEFLDGWGVNNDNWNIQTEVEIKNEFHSDEFSLLARDNVIIALAFAQIVIDGIIDNEIKQKAIWAIERQQNPVLLNEVLLADFHEEWKRRLRLMNETLSNFEQ
ncbi:MAG: hypothetical protein ABJA66_04685 [Actinomycetota bacterium]